MRPRRTRQILAACLAAGLFLAEASVRLTAQGVYQDELHQAADSFSWVGRPSQHYSEMSVGGLPLLNMSYSGAIKTALYGMFLRVSGSEFSVSSWRLAGILFVASALFLFFVLTAPRLPGLSLFLFGALLLSDPSVLLLVRHDYGPVALSLAIRILFCAVWVRSTEEPRPGHAFLLGLLSGIAVFEKLSAVVLFFPLALALAAERRGRRRSWLVSGGAGLAVGLIPLALANGISWARERSLISLADVEQVRRTAAGFARYLWEYFSLGAGRTAREFVLGESPPIWAVLVEGALMLASQQSWPMPGAGSRPDAGIGSRSCRRRATCCARSPSDSSRRGRRLTIGFSGLRSNTSPSRPSPQNRCPDARGRRGALESWPAFSSRYCSLFAGRICSRSSARSWLADIPTASTRLSQSSGFSQSGLRPTPRSSSATGASERRSSVSATGVPDFSTNPSGTIEETTICHPS